MNGQPTEQKKEEGAGNSGKMTNQDIMNLIN